MVNVRADELLTQLFRRHFDDAAEALARLDRHLKQVKLSFDLKEKLRELDFPPQPSVPHGLPSFIYYYVPNSGWGSQSSDAPQPQGSDFVYHGDGTTLNLGCPVRLLRALDLFSHLPVSDQKELREGLENSTKHLVTVEELLWLDGWKAPSHFRRAGILPGAKGDVDWFLNVSGFSLYLEAKFRPSDWPRITDQGTFVPMQGSFLAKAVKKFPIPPHKPALYVVAITAFANLTEPILLQIAEELQAAPQIHAVIFRSLVQMTHVIAQDVGVRDQILSMLVQPSARAYPTNYIVVFHIQQRNERIEESKQDASREPAKETPKISCWYLRPQFDTSVSIPDSSAYRMNINSRGADGEPQFTVIPQFLQ